jgi:two-component system, OmpR family, sensor kinase
VTLRLRLVVGLVVLMTTGLAIFGGTMYGFYSHSQYNALKAQLRSSLPLMTQALAEQAKVQLPGAPGFPPGQHAQAQHTPGTGGASNPAGGDGPGQPDREGDYDGTGAGGDGRGSPPVLVSPGTFGEILGPQGKVKTDIFVETSAARPAVPAGALAEDRPQQAVHLGSVSGDTTWLAYIGARLSNGYRVLIAVPTTSVTDSLNRLVLIELSGAAGLLIILSAGAGLVVRRGLAPLERIAGTAGKIAGGDLDQRVQVPGQATEVGQLAVAFNTMLDEIQAAFSEREATAERLRRFLADASHELRTPLTSIQGFAELSRLGTDSPHVDNDVIMRRIEEEAGRMKGLVEDLLLLARVDQVRQSEKAPVDLAVLAADACSDAVAADPARPVTLSAPQPVVVLGDESHLRQALANLVTNALRYTPAGSPVEVGARLDGGRAVLEVRDHGAGLDEQAMAHAFDRFWQGDASRSAKGAGLGLSIVAAVAAEHEGTVEAGNAPGGGAVFMVHLPLVSGRDGTVAQPAPARGVRPPLRTGVARG